MNGALIQIQQRARCSFNLRGAKVNRKFSLSCAITVVLEVCLVRFWYQKVLVTLC